MLKILKELNKYLTLLILILFLLISSCRQEDNRNKSTNSSKVGLVFDVGGRGDKSFNDAAYEGLVKSKSELGVDFEYLEPGPGGERESALRQFSTRQDIQLIIGIGFMFTEEITKIAQEFPDKKYACVDYVYDSNKTMPSNLVALNFKEQEGAFLIGAIASNLTKTNTLGFIGGMESFQIKKFEVSFVAGAKYIKPDCKILINYAGVTGDGFKNPAKGKELALSQYSQGADIIFHASGVTGLGVFEAARETKKFVIGVDADQYSEAPGLVITSMIKGTDIAVFDCIKEVKDGTFKGGRAENLGLKENGISYVYDDNNRNLISDELHNKIEQIKKDIIEGKITIPTR